jgi:hypothetical protein
MQQRKRHACFITGIIIWPGAKYQGLFFSVSFGALVVPDPFPLVSFPPVSIGVAGNLLVSAGLSLPICAWPESLAALSIARLAELPPHADKLIATITNE